jgi:hypothetical protein
MTKHSEETQAYPRRIHRRLCLRSAGRARLSCLLPWHSVTQRDSLAWKIVNFCEAAPRPRRNAPPAFLISQLFAVVNVCITYGFEGSSPSSATSPFSMPRGQRRARKARQKAAPRLFRIESAQPYGWIVYLDGFPKTHLFVGRSLALMYAREWAKANAPSVIQVADSSGQLEREETYGNGKPPRFRPLVGRRLRETTHG